MSEENKQFEEALKTVTGTMRNMMDAMEALSELTLKLEKRVEELENKEAK